MKHVKEVNYYFGLYEGLQNLSLSIIYRHEGDVIVYASFQLDGKKYKYWVEKSTITEFPEDPEWLRDFCYQNALYYHSNMTGE